MRTLVVDDSAPDTREEDRMGRRFHYVLIGGGLAVLLLAAASGCGSPTPAVVPSGVQEEPSPTPIAQEPAQGTLPGVDADAGKAVFVSKGCVGCHTVQGIPEAQGKVGPELTHQASNPLIAGVLPNSVENLRGFLKDPASVKPGVVMPNLALTDTEIEALVALLGTLK